MTVNITQEIIDWFNEPLEADDPDRAENISEVWEEFYYGLVSKEGADKYGHKTATLASGPAYIEAQYGGEGQGEERWVVFSVAGQFFRVNGYYASWDGTTWEDPTPEEVEPTEVTVIRYERKK